MSASISTLIEPLQPFVYKLVNFAAGFGVEVRITSTTRSRSEQERLYRAFLRGERHYPVAPPGTSAHEFGYAFDATTAFTEDLHDLGAVWQQWGGVWSPSDEVHFEYPGFVHPPVPEDVPVEELQGQLPAEIAGAAASFLPGPVGLLASFGPLIEGKPLFTYDPKTTIWCRLLGVGC